MDKSVSEVVLESRVRQPPARQVMAFSDIRLLLALPFDLVLAWIVPARHWPGLCRWIVRYLRRPNPLAGAIRAVGAEVWCAHPAHAIIAELDALRLEHYFQYLREYRPGGWRPALVLDGRSHLEQAMAEGRGAVLWVGHTVFQGLALKKSLFEAGFALSHLSRPEHGFSKTRFGVAVLNPLRSRIEDRYLRRRIVIERSAEERGVRAAVRELANNRIVSITAGAWEGRQIAHLPFFSGTMSLATGAPALAHATGATLLPVFVIRTAGTIRVIIAAPIRQERRGPRDERLTAAMREYAARLRPIVCEYPGQWRGWAYLRSRC